MKRWLNSIISKKRKTGTNRANVSLLVNRFRLISSVVDEKRSWRPSTSNSTVNSICEAVDRIVDQILTLAVVRDCFLYFQYYNWRISTYILSPSFQEAMTIPSSKEIISWNIWKKNQQITSFIKLNRYLHHLQIGCILKFLNF